MSATQTWCELIGIFSEKVTKSESLLFEAEMFIRVCQAIKENFREKHENFFRLMKFTVEMENEMLEINFIRLIIQDILFTEEYNLSGIANYLHMPEEVVQEVASGLNSNPSATFLQRIIGLHRMVRRELYQAILKKILSEHDVS